MGKKIGIMQPYFLPYMGYWQLINYVDEFVLYDNIKYTKKGWINRNRFLQNGTDALFSLPLKSDSDSLDVTDRFLSPDFDREKMLRQFREAYRKAPHFEENVPLIEEIVKCAEQNLFDYIENSVTFICDYLDIKTKIVISSDIEINHDALKAEDKVVALCHALEGDDYINPIGGLELYDKAFFAKAGLELSFLRARRNGYPQFVHDFVPHLSILDVLMFNSRDRVKDYLNEFDLL